MAEAKVKAIPQGYHSVTAHLIVDRGAEAIEFYKRAFGAEELVRMPGPDGRLMHAEIRIGDSPIMLADESPEMGNKSPKTLGGTACGLMIYCENVDQLFERATKAGATVVMPPADMFWGDRYCLVMDPFGHKWSLGTHIKDLTPAEMAKGQADWMKQQKK
jgi:uncharacterized glyoxalase superfamily protein PhnB